MSHFLVRLVRSLDLRFADPQAESLYHNYYAQVKRNLLPTAIQVVLIVNVLQFLATCLNYYLLVDGRHHYIQQPRDAESAAGQPRPADQDLGRSAALVEEYARTLVWPLLMQTAVFVATFAMLKIVRAEVRVVSEASEAEANQSNESLSSVKQRAAGGSDDSEGAADQSGRGSGSRGRQQANNSSRSWAKYTKHQKSPTTTSGRHSGASGLSTSLSLAIEMPLAGPPPGRPNDDEDDEGDETPDELDRLKEEGAPAAAGGASENHHRRTATARKSGSLERNHSRRRRFSSSCAQQTKLSRFKLSLPYVLWACQLIQLASGLWPQQSFIAYATLLLYSYAIYVIFPIRLHSCILLAAGLSLVQPVLDYLLMLNLCNLFGAPNQSSAGGPAAPPALAMHSNYDNNNAGDFVPHKLAAEPLVATNSSDLIAQQQQQQQQQQQLQLQQNHSLAGHFPSRTIDSLLNNALEIPMTSQISKLWAFMLLTLGINVIGIMSFFFYERQQRAAYLETRQSLETKLILEQESREQERLLLSILPKHLAAEIRQDLGAVVTGQFKKIYMSRHENVSILFADIVGFTAISSNCPAPELVKTLNELFARFDKLAEKYHQLRIKILGDCYYAISGAPKERPDHAVLCVHMGLSMVEAVKSVRERTKSPVDMRVGVHTGGVLAGVLGQRQWQFDVYSKDVELANKMESSGLPGRVHISNATLRFLNDEFEVTEGDGASREEALRLANIRTYFIDRVKKPYPEGTLDALEPRPASDGQRPPAPPQQQQKLAEAKKHKPTATDKQPGKRPASNEHELAVVAPGGAVEEEKQQQQQQANRNDSFNLDRQIRALSLNFSNRHFERQFRSTSDIASCISLVGLPITLICAFLAYVYLYKIQLEVTVFYATNSSILLLIVLICVLPYLWRKHSLRPTPGAPARREQQQQQFQCLTRLIVNVSEVVGRSAWIKLALSSTMTLIWLSAHLVACKQIVRQFERRQLVDAPGLGSLELFSVDLLNYYTITCALAVTAITRISFLVKTILILIVILQQVILNQTILADILLLRSTMILAGPRNSSAPVRPHIRLDSLLSAAGWQPAELSIDFNQFAFAMALATICWALLLINRQSELTNRRLFLWRKQVEERKEKVADMRRKNEALVYNILPPNVAKIFLGRRQFNDEELYSKSYDAVGVLFAAMPNFSDFYTEESVNNQGLECLRFLNEVISDYDALLDQARFKNIIKIKTMGPTYMAASGLYEGDAQAEREAARAARDSDEAAAASSPLLGGARESPDEVHSKWGHLEQLTEFALALKETLNNINKESFNNFVLRIGINQGPITAGVIGVKKPHFDMWGNTVNVASRMESTGRAGSIQVVEETATILRHFGFEFDQRGLVSVKGKGKLMTFYLTGRTSKPTGQQQPPPPRSSSAAGLAVNSSGHQPQQQQQNGAASGLSGSVSMDSRQSLVNCSKATIVPKATGASNASLATSNANHQSQTSSSSNNNMAANLGLQQQQQQTPGGATTTTSPSSDRRMFIRPSKADFVGDSSADIDLV